MRSLFRHRLIFSRRLSLRLATLVALGAFSLLFSMGLAQAGRRANRPEYLLVAMLPWLPMAPRPTPLGNQPMGTPLDFEDPSHHALDRFHQALARAQAGEGQAHLVFYGGSHTASDLYTGQVRELLQGSFGDAGHGFLPLVPVVNQAWAWGMRIDEAEGFEVSQVGFKLRQIRRYGLAGVAFFTDEPAAFAAVESADRGSGRHATHLRFFYDRQPFGGHVNVVIDGEVVDRLATAAPGFEGAIAEYEVPDGLHRFEVRAEGDGPTTIYGIAFDHERPGVVVDNLGLVGAKARHQLFWDREQWQAFFQSRQSDLWVFAYGNNETTDTHLTLDEHEAHLRQTLERMQSAAPESDCLLLGPTDRPRRNDEGALETRPVVASITDMQRRVAFDMGCAFFDTLAFQGGLGAGARWFEHDPPYMRDDLQHLSRLGYLRWGEVLTRALLRGYEPIAAASDEGSPAPEPGSDRTDVARGRSQVSP